MKGRKKRGADLMSPVMVSLLQQQIRQEIMNTKTVFSLLKETEPDDEAEDRVYIAHKEALWPRIIR